jgi:hypothetical protein
LLAYYFLLCFINRINLFDCFFKFSEIAEVSLEAKIDKTMDKFDKFARIVDLNALTQLDQTFMKINGEL